MAILNQDFITNGALPGEAIGMWTLRAWVHILTLRNKVTSGKFLNLYFTFLVYKMGMVLLVELLWKE